MKRSSINIVTGLIKHIVSGVVFITTIILINSAVCFAQTKHSKSPVSDKIFENTLVRMTWPEVKEAADKKAIVLVPISIVEEHGPHMDLSPDILGSVICSIIKENLEKDSIPTVIAPPMYWGISLTTNFLPGTINIKESTIKLLLTEIVENMVSWGFERFYFFGFHGDPAHSKAVSRIAASIDSSGIAKVYDASELPETPDTKMVYPENPGMYQPDYHAGAVETNMVWKIDPSIIRMDKVSSLKPQDNFAPLGYVGDPANFMKINIDPLLDDFPKLLAKRIKKHISATDNTHE